MPAPRENIFKRSVPHSKNREISGRRVGAGDGFDLAWADKRTFRAVVHFVIDRKHLPGLFLDVFLMPAIQSTELVVGQSQE
jgi:hypothetical protein